MRLAYHSTKLRFSVYHFLISATPMGQPKYISAHHGAPFASKMRAAPWPPQAFTGWEKTCQVWKFGRIRDDTSILVISCFQINQSYGYFTGNVRLSENPKEIMMINHNFPYSLIARFVFFSPPFSGTPSNEQPGGPSHPSQPCPQPVSTPGNYIHRRHM